MRVTIDEMVAFCKRKGFVYSGSELYGGLAGIFDYGPNGVDMKNNIKKEWWKSHVQIRDDIVGIDGAIITHEGIWKASGHLSSFGDLMLICSKCKNRERADSFLETKLNKSFAGINSDEVNMLVTQNKIKCPKCKGIFEKCTDFNLMFPVMLGEGNKGYLRGETAQVIFNDFQLVVNNSRLKLPFGIAQIGKAFRNEISPRNFLFRCREFEQMELEYFVDPKEKECPYIKGYLDFEVQVKTYDMNDHEWMKIKDILDQKLMHSWHAYWLVYELKWFLELGSNKENFRFRQHNKNELAHYSTDCWDMEYNFPFGWKELEGIADRSDYDLKQHREHSKKDLFIVDDFGKKLVPHVIAEPSLGVDRAFLVFMFEAYYYNKERDNIILKLHPKIAPYQIAVYPLVKKLSEETKLIYDELKQHFNCIYDESGSVGRRYARADEIGVPFCVAFDFDSNDDKKCTIRERDSGKQIRVSIKELVLIFSGLICLGKNIRDYSEVF